MSAEPAPPGAATSKWLQHWPSESELLGAATWKSLNADLGTLARIITGGSSDWRALLVWMHQQKRIG